MPPEMDWETREAERRKKGEYTPLAKKFQPRGFGDDGVWYLARITEDKQITFYENVKAARHDILTTMKPTRYLSRFVCHGDDDLMWEIMAELGLAGAGLHLGFARSREDIRFVYENGPDSCMAGEAGRFYSSHVHPVEAYASPDLGVAYLLRGSEDMRDDEAVIVARAVCNMNTKEWVRIYGEHKRMGKLLEEQGFMDNPFCLGGCRLLKVYGKDHEGRTNRRVIMTPYLDGPNNKMKITAEDKDHLIVVAQDVVLYAS
jgi:hypothetical protein